ncbi:MAG: asparagine synthase (glutamine-hydrolyzing) [bacterium]|nr:asparagine synthase (glutamine-hydrolyzing) [bacterium]
MCGIAGIIQWEPSTPGTCLKQMLDLISHRGPDGEGQFSENGVQLGHRRLAIIDLSEAANQPMHYQDRYTVIHNGEIYNYLELRDELQALGYSFTTSSDTQVILAAYAEWGTASAHKFNGMWAFALYDRVERRVWISRDRFGIKPLYYLTHQGAFYFASEIKAFKAIEGLKWVLNQEIMDDFMVHGLTDHRAETFIQGIQQVKGGHEMVLSLNSPSFSVKPWYHLSTQEHGYNDEKAIETFQDLFESAVCLRLRSDVTLGSCLSGGLDSSAIVACASELLAKTPVQSALHTISSCSKDPAYDEQEFVNALAKRYPIKTHRIFPSLRDFLNDLDEVIWHQDQPFTTSSISAQWHVFKAAKKEGLIVMLDGQGADEQLAGYHHFFPPLFAHLLKTGHWIRLIRELRFYRRKHGHSLLKTLQVLLFSLVPSIIFRYIWQSIGKGRPSWLLSTSKSHLLKRRLTAFSKGIQSTSIAELQWLNLSMLLRYEDRNSMAHSIESRLPFLDYRLVEHILGLRDDQKIRDGVTKWVLRQSEAPRLPNKILNRMDKMGFVTAEKKWLKEEPELFISELNKAKQILAPIIDCDQFDEYIRSVSNGKITFSPWKVICLARWMRRFDVTFE